MSTSTFPTSLDTYTNPTATNTTNSPSLSAGQTLQNDSLAALEATIGVTGSSVTSSIQYFMRTGWIPVIGSWTYSSWDVTSTTGVLTVPSNATLTYSVGMRVSMTDNAVVLYGIVTAVTITTLTVFFGPNYTLTNNTITAPFYSTAKNPNGWPAAPSNWSVTVTDTGDRTVSTATQNTWYNISQLGITVPIGVWYLGYEVNVLTRRLSSGTCNIITTMGTTSASAGDLTLTALTETRAAYDSSALSFTGLVKRSEYLAVSSKTPYYFNTETNTTSNSTLGILGSTGATSVVTLVSAYI